MKKLITTILGTILLTSCGKVESVKQMTDFTEFDDLEERVTDLENRMDEVESNLSSLFLSIDDLEVNQDTLEQSIALNASDLATLTTQVNGDTSIKVTRMIDPCGDKPNQFDEYILEMSNGDLLGYFEQGGKRFLTVLPDGNYRTTDIQACNFSVVKGKYQE